MRILVNYGLEEEKYLPGLAVILRNMGLEALSTKQTYSVDQLINLSKSVNVEAIVLCNEDTLQNFIPQDLDKKATLDNWRGSRLNFNTPIIVVNKLAHMHTVPYGRWLLESDLSKLNHIHKRPTPFSFEKLLSVHHFDAAYQDLKESICIYYDIETKTFDPKQILDERGNAIEGAEEVGETVITCASWTGIFENGQLRTYMLPMINFDGIHWKSDQEYVKAFLFMKRVNALRIPKAMHNGMYDATHSIIHNAPPLFYTLDTMALAHAQFSELPKDLAFVASYNLFDYINWKGDAASASFGKDQEKYWRYNARDTWHGARILVSQLRNSPAYTFSNYKSSFPLTYPSLYGNFEGLLIDRQKRIESRAKGDAAVKAARVSLQTKFADPKFNPGSWQQVEYYIYKLFGAKKPGIGKSASNTDEKNLVAVGEQHPILALITRDILSYRENQKAVSTYHDFLQYRDRLLWALDPFGTETGRMACKASSLWCGTQVQNVPGYAKPMLIADPGFELFEADNKQSEGRTTAYLAQDEALIAALEDPVRDFYKTLGTLFFSIPYEEVTTEFRNDVLKRIVHGTNYMMGAWTFIENIGISVLHVAAHKLGIKLMEVPTRGYDNEMTVRQFAQMLLDSYHKPFPRVREWYKEIFNEIASTGFSISPLGHVRKFFGDISKDHKMLRSAVAHKSQHLSVAILNRGFRRVYRELVLPGKGDIRIKAQIHDSIFGQVRIGMRDYYAPRILECMDNPIEVHGRTLKIPVDLNFGQNWGKFHKEKNPNGMRAWVPPKQLTQG